MKQPLYILAIPSEQVARNARSNSVNLVYIPRFPRFMLQRILLCASMVLITPAMLYASDMSKGQVGAVQVETPPVISVPADIQLRSIDGNPVPASIGQATATDNLPGPVTLSNNAPALFPVGTTTVIWTATDASGNSSTAVQSVVVVWDQQYLANLPPDPGAAGKATLAGIDAGGDGVRDDVQRWIALTYPNSQKTRAVLTQRVKVIYSITIAAQSAGVDIWVFQLPFQFGNELH